MKVLFRADSSTQIGSGHVMRCLTLAQALARNGASVVFLSEELEGNVNAQIKARGFAVEKPVGLYSKKFDWCVVDHYGLGSSFETSARDYAQKIMVIDDLANRDHDCDLLLDQNFFADMEVRYKKRVPEKCRQLLGPQYALLREEFAEKRKNLNRQAPIKRIVLFFGGSDPTNETSKALRALNTMNLDGSLKIDVLIGDANPFRNEIKNQAATLPQATCRPQTDQLAQMLADANLAVCAGGTTTWERCCLGVPSIVIAVAENQILLSEEMEKLGCQKFLGPSSSVDEAKIVQSIRYCIEHADEALQMGMRGMGWVDGLGVTRVVAAMEDL